jgi:MFS family permease
VPQVGPWRHIIAVLPLSGIGMSLFWPSLQAWIAEHSTGAEGLNRNLGRFNILWSIGLMLGPLATSYLWVVSHDLTFVLPSALLLLLIPVALLTPRGARPTEMADGAPSEEDGPHPEADLFLRLAWIGNFAAFFIGGIILAMFPKLGWELKYSEPSVGWLLFGYRLAQVLMFIYTSREARWQYRLWPLLAAEGVAAAGMVVAAFARTPALFAIGFATAGACAGVTYVASLFYSLHGREDGRGRNSGFHEAVLGSGGFLGPLLAGIAAQFIDIQYTFLMAAGMMVVGVGLQATLYRSCRRAPG